MTRETKVGFMMVALLVGVFGFLAYKQYNRLCDAHADQTAESANPAYSNDVIPRQSDGFSNDSIPEANNPFVEEKPKRKKQKLPAVIVSDDSDFQEVRERKAERTRPSHEPKLEPAGDPFEDASEQRNSPREIQQVTGTSESDPFASDSSEPDRRSNEPAVIEPPRRVRQLSVPTDLDYQVASNERSTDSDGFDENRSSKKEHREEADPFSTGREERSDDRNLRATGSSESLGNDFEKTQEPAARPMRRAAPALIDESEFSRNPVLQTPGSFTDDTYVIQPSDSYWTISRKRYGSGRYFMALFRHNEQTISDPKRMKPGVTISTPHPEVLERRYANVISKPASAEPSTSVVMAAHSRNAEESALPGFFTNEEGAPMYRVGDRDTLTEISRAHLGRTSRWIQILEMNRNVLRDGNELKIGTVLRLPADASRVQVVGTVRQYR